MQPRVEAKHEKECDGLKLSSIDVIFVERGKCFCQSFQALYLILQGDHGSHGEMLKFKIRSQIAEIGEYAQYERQYGEAFVN